MTASVQRDWCMSMDAGGLRKPEETQSSSAEVQLTRDLSVASVFLQKRCANGCRRSSADFGSSRTIFHQIMGHGSHALKNLDPGVGERFRRMNRVQPRITCIGHEPHELTRMRDRFHSHRFVA